MTRDRGVSEKVFARGAATARGSTFAKYGLRLRNRGMISYASPWSKKYL
jgi:hypothetical protein